MSGVIVTTPECKVVINEAVPVKVASEQCSVEVTNDNAS